MKFTQSCLYTALSVAFAHNAFAGQESDTMTVWSSPASAATTTVLGQQTMQDLDKQNVAQALSVIPGVALQKSGNRNEQQVKVRGFDSRQVPIFFDGVPVYIPYDGNLDLGRFLTSDIASVEVSKGYSSLLQGPNQMAARSTSPPKNRQNLSKGASVIARDGAEAKITPTICTPRLAPVMSWVICKSAVAS